MTTPFWRIRYKAPIAKPDERMDWLGQDFLFFVLVGLLAQLIDGALGMAYGLISSSVLLAMGLPPATVSASVHTAEVFTSGVSGISHALHRNVDRRLFLRLAAPGVVGGVAGAYLLSRVPGDAIKPYVLGYLLLLAVVVLARAIRGRHRAKREIRHVPALGLVAGFLDAIGGGGWGAMATSTLLAKGGQVRTTVGSVSAAEFAVTLATSLTFLIHLGITHWDVIAGLLVGGVVAAPLAAWLVKRVPERPALGAVGALILGISAYQLARVFA